MPKTNIKVKLTGTDGNVFSVIGNVEIALKRGGEAELAKEFQTKAFEQESYHGVLALAMEYVEVS